MSADPAARLADFEADGWELDDGEAINREAPETFPIPGAARRAALLTGDIVKLMFRIALRHPETGAERAEVERMWVVVKSRRGTLYEGVLDNDPYCTEGIRSGMPVFFEPRHVIAIYDG